IKVILYHGYLIPISVKMADACQSVKGSYNLFTREL
ncbi:unnamed protein product, partial [Heterotrigona itama]